MLGPARLDKATGLTRLEKAMYLSFGVTLFLYLHSEMYNWMIGCDASGCFSSRVTDWRYREVGEDESAESERSCPSPLLSMALLGPQCHTRRGSSNW